MPSSSVSIAPAYGRMRRLADAIHDPDSTIGQRARWRQEHSEVTTRLASEVGVRAVRDALLVEHATRRREEPDGRVARNPDRDGVLDCYL